MNPLTRFFHELFHPHCEQCAIDREFKAINPVVENLKRELAHLYKTLENLQVSNPIVDVLRAEVERAYRNNDKLLEQIFDKIRYERDFVERTVVNPPPASLAGIPTLQGSKTWAARRKELETQSRLAAQEIARLKTEGITPVTEESLEQELEQVKKDA